ncbi:HD domain-containing protein [Faecalitalea cylindroides]|uniref:HD domain protein n=1 Tax=Faecalitalea cylindroides ATCC 27803 TaxID=649755 RepID=U2R2U8_9FIRM|nr:HD domain-containing protein [Faecalitalea cylindroides]ERK44982.1 hypothetical protein HMPREF0367_01238 [[Eubacterium] cylindroides ATCC 27803] [Faecalitalea cylindroides ATCC 27803]
MYAQRAYALAKKAHLGQKDKGGNDYIEHPKAVASMMDTDIEKAVAYLHDVVEDTNISFDDLKEYGFPNQIIEALKALTKQKNESYDVYIDRVIRNPIAKKVKLADMKHNSDITRIKNPSQKDYDRCQKYLDKIQYLINKPLS